jgi:hypothetical protein
MLRTHDDACTAAGRSSTTTTKPDRDQQVVGLMLRPCLTYTDSQSRVEIQVSPRLRPVPAATACLDCSRVKIVDPLSRLTASAGCMFDRVVGCHPNRGRPLIVKFEWVRTEMLATAAELAEGRKEHCSC